MPGDRPIVGGASSDADEVMALRVRAACGEPPLFICSAVRVSPRALVTAAHCVADTPAGLFEVVRGADAADPAAPPVRVASIWFAPTATDLALIATTEPITGATVALGDVPADPTGASVTIIGYGDDGTGRLGIRRSGTATIDRFDAATVGLVPGPALTCGGDSGGAVLLGGELVAITSYGDPQCAISSTAVRIDASRGFIDDGIVMAAAFPENQPAAGEADCGEPTGSCSASTSPDLALVLTALLVLFVVACGKSKSGPCGRLHGDPPPKGTLVWCTDAAGTKDGAYKEWWPSGTPKVETSYRKGRQHGAFASWHETGKPHEQGTLTDGLRTGRWTEHDDAGKLKRESDYGAGGSTVRWTVYRQEDGTRWMEGGFKGQREHGRFIEWYPDGKKMAEGDFTDGKKSGPWTYWNPDGSVSMQELGSFASNSFGAEGTPGP